ncbi:protein-disulfide reductase DsbD family protein [Ferruginibacter yonginensis]|uniref:Protein-disulfide reductase DsbD family protein n=1 Tax=Ferruginibacter yonginensis TaxID=1310416 RepID=A0ABV8QUC2_9BACT
MEQPFFIKNVTMRLQLKYTLLFIIFFSVINTTFAQDSVQVKWTAAIQKKDATNYTVKLVGTIQKGWHVYTKANTEASLEGITIISEDSTANFMAPNIITKGTIAAKDVLPFANLYTVTDSVVIEQQVTATKPLTAIALKLSYELGSNEAFITETQSLIVNTDASKNNVVTSNRILIPTINIEQPVDTYATATATANKTESQTGLFALFLLGFAGGLVALLTPCVFPMIPLTVSFFTKKSETRQAGIRNAFLYGFFIFFIYVLLSVPFHFIDKLNPDILNNISTNVTLNVVFFVIFIVFALSFFGLYEITLPSSFTNKTDSKAGAGNIIGIFFMALTLALVSFSCTGPILGSLLAGSLTADGGAMQLTAGMGGFGLALALPFALFALFPGLLKSLPKSGGWLTTVKVVLGFLELALAFKFLSNADLVKHWGLLKREIFIGIWIVIGVLLSLYLFDIIRFKHEMKLKKVPVVRMLLGTLVAFFTMYLVPGLTNTAYANLKLISGFPPPLYYSVYAGKSDCVLNLNCTKDYEEGLRMAKEQNKPMLIDFTGYACVNCRRMEENVWSDREVFELLKQHFIIVSLYVDDKKQLPIEKRFTYTSKDGSKRKVTTVGDKWSLFETENFKNNAQPYYAIVDTNEKLLNVPTGYTPSAKEYLLWLQNGLTTFNKKQ